MTRTLIVGLLGGAFALGIAASASAEDWRHQRWCDYRDTNCDGRLDWRDRYYGSPQPYYRQQPRTTYEPAGRCVFQTSRGPVYGYRPEGKDRCCIETSRGPSCQ
ncbi:MAG TPA: hypothetical protein VJ890_28985 [Vineibacter sp.]|nr:hypothetical protein [Vineibacter sp.]